MDSTIPVVGSSRYPAISAGTASVKNLTLNSGAALTQTGGTLDVRADLTNNGTIQLTGGTVVLGTTTQASILGSGNTRFWDLTVNSNGVLLRTSASTSVQRLLTLNGAIVTQSNPLTLESNATNTALVVNKGSSIISGNVAVQRYIAPDRNPGLGYRHYSSPVSTATVGSLAIPGSFTPVVNPNYNTSATPGAETLFPTVYFYDQARLATATNYLAPFDKGWTSPSALTDPLTVGQGYTVNLAANQTLSVTGPQNNGAVTQSLSRTTAFPIDAGWQLVGNPYPSPLDYSLLAPAERVGCDAAMYVFESASQYGGLYRSYINGVGGNPILAQGQGFFARVSTGQTSGTLNFRNSQRVTAYTNPVYHRTAETRPLVQLDLQGAGKADPLYVYFKNGATTGIDREFDAVKLSNSTGLNVSVETGTERLAVNGLPALGTATVTVPLAVGVPAAGLFSYNAAQRLNLGTTPVYLRDKQTGAVVDLRTQPFYRFVVSNATALITGRFELVCSPQGALATAPAALAAQVGVYPNPATTTAFVELPAALGLAVAAELVDALGRTVRAQQLPAQGAAAHRLDLANLATGVYTLHLNTSASVVGKKLVVQLAPRQMRSRPPVLQWAGGRLVFGACCPGGCGGAYWLHRWQKTGSM
ncbi:MAG: T9SS type A sorting domain-containing protein [Bacteroidota bacterium]|nr:T9SS type A sorting domain-containing protein [Bacteroidota bacterium]